MKPIELPELCLVVLVGVTGSGKSTFARKHFPATQVLSSDAFRALVADDENDQSASGDAFDALHYVAAKRLKAGRLTVVDATNVQSHARAALVALARDHDVLPVAIVLDVPEDECWARTQTRPDRDFGRPVVTRQHRDLRRSLARLGREGFRQVHLLRGTSEVDEAVVSYQRLFNNRKDLTGPFDIIGDVHGCLDELRLLLSRLGYPQDGAHPEGRTAVFVGDLVDRGPDSPGVLKLVMDMVSRGAALCVSGNHEAKLVRKLRGAEVKVAHGLQETLDQLALEDPAFVASARDFMNGLISHYVLDGGKLVVSHAGLKEEYQGRASGRVRAFCLYGDTTGETDDYGLPVRYPWAVDYRGRAMVVYGHTPTPKPEWVNNTICLDTGCVFGGELTALRYPSRELVSVPAARVYYEPARPLVAPATARDGAGNPAWDGAVNLADVTGRRHLETGFGRVAVAAENAAAALEVMSRFAIAPELLSWLPPTMAPCSTSTVDGYLEHPHEAFEDYRKAGVRHVVCQEKHMGSRAVLRVDRDRTRSAIYTRTGRPFFPDEHVGHEVLARVRSAAEPLLAELDSDWLLLDAELLPWSAKAGPLIRDQYAAVAAAGGAALPFVNDALAAAAARGLDVGELRDRTLRRTANLARFTDVYRRYCWPTSGVTGLTIAPFHLLASAGANHARRDHAWHLAMVDRLADPLFTPTRHMLVDVTDPASVDAATAWWLELTAAGGEGMVVKPAADAGPRVQPAIKCRGREYLRIIYGPDYLEPATLTRLRQRGLGRKRGLALREQALGLAALDALAEGAAPWRVHQLVFAILACESEPVDPRL